MHLKKWANQRPLVVYFRSFLITISIIQIEKSVDGVLGIRTLGYRMVGADKTTELCRPPDCVFILPRCLASVTFQSFVPL